MTTAKLSVAVATTPITGFCILDTAIFVVATLAAFAVACIIY